MESEKRANKLAPPHFSVARMTACNARRKSDFCALNSSTRYSENNNLATLNAIGAHSSTVCLQRTASDRRFAMPSSLTSPSIASAVANNNGNNGVVALSMASNRRRCSRVINFGYACAIYYLDEPAEVYDDDDEFDEEELGMLSYQTVVEPLTTDDLKLIGGLNNGTEAVKSTDKELGNGIFGHQSSVQESDSSRVQIRSDNHDTHQQQDEVSAAAGELFLLRDRNEEIPHYCIRPQGIEADRFIQQFLSERNRSEIKKFLERNVAPEDGDWSYLWISQDLKLENCPVFIFSIKMLENFFKNERIRRVKWRHLSVDKISVYRYSLPQITTKFRLRIAHFLVRHYRCCILCVWLLIILCISVGIIFSVMFGAAPSGSSKLNATYLQHTAHQEQHSGGFMADEIVGDETAIGEEVQHQHLESQKIIPR
uniref:SUN domain-containing protein n=1 Tax=Globodera pallida TaxID=36090 RepID=A0A183CPF4_GLOPA